MCGIAGFVGHGDRQILQRMTDALAHRGPDDSGFHCAQDEAVFLGHRRLAIVDVAGGHQPMWDAEKTVAVTYNGEIYNHRELRAELVALGHRFQTDHCDTEVLIHGYKQWGADLPLRLNGMFAFAIYDRARRRLFLARDRFGEKPLFYSNSGGTFAFASEIGGLRAHPDFDDGIDIRALQKFFAWGYLPGAHCLQRGGAKLPHGHHLTYEIATGAMSVQPYWQFQLTPDHGLTDAQEDALAEELGALLRQAARRRLMSDVPLGMFLSGGIDSSAIVASLAGGGAPKIRTFTIGFNEKSFDESAHARVVAEAFGTDHREQILDAAGARDLMAHVLSRLDEPVADPSILPTYLLSRFTREHVTVALSGDGGDELFAGYDPFKALSPAALYAKLVPSGLHRAARRLADFLPISPRNMSFDFKLRRALLGLSYPQAVWNPAWMSLLEPELMAEVFEAPMRLEDLYAEAIALWTRDGAGDTVDRSLEFFTNFYLPDDILTKVDRASMMVSLESRAVFLDNDLVAFCQRLPHRFKFRDGEGKYLLKKALRGILPPSILTRPKKGFGIPLREWMGAMPAPGAVAGMRAEGVARLVQEDARGQADHRLFVWGLMALQGMNGARTLPALAEA